MSFITGTAGGKIGNSPDSSWTNLSQRLILEGIGPDTLLEQLFTYPFPRDFSLVLNNTCPLQCEHCYLQVKRMQAPPLNEAEWFELIPKVLEHRPDLLAFAGKEVFFDQRGPRILQKTGEMINKHASQVRLGVVTNGIFLHRYEEIVKGLPLDYLDISIDGTPADHDAIRGKNAFARTQPNLLWAAHHLGPRFFVSLTVQRRNLKRIGDAVRHLCALGVPHVSLGFFKPTPYTNPLLNLPADAAHDVFRQLEALASVELPRPMNVLVEVDCNEPNSLLAFVGSHWFRLDRMTSDRNDTQWIDYSFTNGLRVQFRFTPLPSSVFRSVRITSEGLYLASDDIGNTRLYAERAIANVRDFGGDFAALNNFARTSIRARRIVEDFCAELAPRIVRTYREQNPHHRTSFARALSS